MTSPEPARTRRDTRQRRLVRQALASFPDFRSAQEIHSTMVAQGLQVGRATVFRTLRTLALDEGVDVIVRSDGETVYRACTRGHHHHLVCRECGDTIEVIGPVVEQWSNATAAAYGYDEVEHTVEIFGRCTSCRDRV